MLNKSQKSLLRAELFKHLDGIVVAPIAYCLFDNEVTDFIIEQKKTSLQEITKMFNANDSYLNVALRTLASQGWLGYKLNGGEVKSN